MASPKDKELYEKVKKEVYGRYKTHSAYRSGILTKNIKKLMKKNTIQKMLILVVKI